MKFHLDVKERKMLGALAAALFLLVGYCLTLWRSGLPFGEYAAAISALYLSFAGANAISKKFEQPQK
jgi:hypothetical protein